MDDKEIIAEKAKRKAVAKACQDFADWLLENLDDQDAFDLYPLADDVARLPFRIAEALEMKGMHL